MDKKDFTWLLLEVNISERKQKKAQKLWSLLIKLYSSEWPTKLYISLARNPALAYDIGSRLPPQAQQHFYSQDIISDHLCAVDAVDPDLLGLILNCVDQPRPWADDTHPLYRKKYTEVTTSDILEVLVNIRDNGPGWLNDFVCERLAGYESRFPLKLSDPRPDLYK